MNWELLNLPDRTKLSLAPILFLTTALAPRTSPGQLYTGQPGVIPVRQQASMCKVNGVVKNSLTGPPIERALLDGQIDAALSDRDGRFELHLPCGGYWQLQVRRLSPGT